MKGKESNLRVAEGRCHQDSNTEPLEEFQRDESIPHSNVVSGFSLPETFKAFFKDDYESSNVLQSPHQSSNENLKGSGLFLGTGFFDKKSILCLRPLCGGNEQVASREGIKRLNSKEDSMEKQDEGPLWIDMKQTLSEVDSNQAQNSPLNASITPGRIPWMSSTAHEESLINRMNEQLQDRQVKPQDQQMYGQQKQGPQEQGQQEHGQQEQGQQHDEQKQDEEERGQHKQIQQEQGLQEQEMGRQEHGQREHGQQEHGQQEHGQQQHRQQEHGQQQHRQQDDGQQHNGQQHDGQEHDGQQHDGRQYDGQQHDGQQHDGQQHDGQQHDVQQHDGQQQHGQQARQRRQGQLNTQPLQDHGANSGQLELPWDDRQKDQVATERSQRLDNQLLQDRLDSRRQEPLSSLDSHLHNQVLTVSVQKREHRTNFWVNQWQHDQEAKLQQPTNQMRTNQQLETQQLENQQQMGKNLQRQSVGTNRAQERPERIIGDKQLQVATLSEQALLSAQVLSSRRTKCEVDFAQAKNDHSLKNKELARFAETSLKAIFELVEFDAEQDLQAHEEMKKKILAIKLLCAEPSS